MLLHHLAGTGSSIVPPSHRGERWLWSSALRSTAAYPWPDVWHVFDLSRPFPGRSLRKMSHWPIRVSTLLGIVVVARERLVVPRSVQMGSLTLLGSRIHKHSNDQARQASQGQAKRSIFRFHSKRAQQLHPKRSPTPTKPSPTLPKRSPAAPQVTTTHNTLPTPPQKTSPPP